MILNINKKSLFQFAIHPFNSIIQELEDGNFLDIINIKYLKYNNENISYLEVDKINSFGHDCILIHQKYKGVKLVHNYTLKNNKIIIYNFINNMYNIKINNFLNDINSNKFLCFITFLLETNVNNQELVKMINVLKINYNIKNFVIFIFTNDKINESLIIPPEYEIIYIEQIFGDDAHRSIDYRINTSMCIYSKFKERMLKYEYDLPIFDENNVREKIPKLSISYLDFLSPNGL